MSLDVFLSPQAWLAALIIFALRVLNMSIDTIRVLFVVRGRKGLAWLAGFISSILFILIFSSVVSHLDNPLNVIAYGAGFGTGSVVGIYIVDRLALGHIHLTIVSSALGTAIATQLRAGGFAVTEVPARGKDGMVAMLHCDVLRRDVETVKTLILESDPIAFVTAEDVRPLWRGFWRIP